MKVGDQDMSWVAQISGIHVQKYYENGWNVKNNEWFLFYLWFVGSIQIMQTNATWIVTEKIGTVKFPSLPFAIRTITLSNIYSYSTPNFYLELNIEDPILDPMNVILMKRVWSTTQIELNGVERSNPKC